VSDSITDKSLFSWYNHVNTAEKKKKTSYVVPLFFF
jgi:hypothetical protein